MPHRRPEDLEGSPGGSLLFFQGPFLRQRLTAAVVLIGGSGVVALRLGAMVVSAAAFGITGKTLGRLVEPVDVFLKDQFRLGPLPVGGDGALAR